MRQIVFDTETTGFNAEGDDRIVEIGALEVINFLPTGKSYHQYINPERDVPEAAANVHGLTTERLKDEPVYAEIVGAFTDFIGDSDLVAHNAKFDMRFINAEYKRLGMPEISMTRAIDTLGMARKMFPGANNTLDALCRRFTVDNSARTFHGALLDAELLAEVYLELSGGRQQGLGLAKKTSYETDKDKREKKVYLARAFDISAQEKAAFDEMLNGMNEPLWLKNKTAM